MVKSVSVRLGAKTDHAHILQSCSHRDHWGDGSRRGRGFSDVILRGVARLRRCSCFRWAEVNLHSSSDELFKADQIKYEGSLERKILKVFKVTSLKSSDSR